MLVAFTALSKAQQGRVGINTTTPAATLDVVANTTDNARPDAILVPRLSRADLEAKTNAYANGTATGASAQNGALVFVNALGGTGTGKTVNVIATGFYYYDGTNGNNVWKPVGGGASTPQRYEGIIGSTTTVDAAYTVTGNDFFVITNGTAAFTITLPAATPANAGRVVVVSNQNTASSTITVASANGVPVAGTNTLLQFRGKQYISDGTRWVTVSYN